MKVYKNPFVSNSRYFIPLKKGHSRKMEASLTEGIEISDFTGKWEIRFACNQMFGEKMWFDKEVRPNADKELHDKG